MELFTLGRTIYPGREVPLWHNARETFIAGLGVGTRLRLILVEKGAGILRLDNRRIAFNAPALLCIHERESLLLEHGSGIEATALYFHPSVINSAFSLENIRQEPDDFQHTDWQDRNWLAPFIDRGAGRAGLVSLAPIMAGRIAQQIAIVSRELDEQRDWFWPCRSRSYFLELLFLVDRIYREPDVAEIGVLSQAASTAGIGEVIMYLHSHYNEKVNLNDLARHFHTNRTTLTRQFRAATGLPVMTYLVNLRMHLASLMLRNTNAPITDVMQRVGFFDDTHFTRTFRKYTQATPSEYRQRYC